LSLIDDGDQPRRVRGAQSYVIKTFLLVLFSVFFMFSVVRLLQLRIRMMRRLVC